MSDSDPTFGVLLFLILWIGFGYLVGLAGKDRKIGFRTAFILSLIFSPAIGLIAANWSKKIDIKEEIKLLADNKLAKKAESKGQIDQAIDHYMNSLYHIENDYMNKKLDPKTEEVRQKTIKDLTEKIEELKKLKVDRSTN